jgi:hypothetical protein
MNKRAQPHGSTKKASHSAYDALPRFHVPFTQMRGRPIAASAPGRPTEQLPYAGVDLATLALPPQLPGALRSGPGTRRDQVAPTSVRSDQAANSAASMGSVQFAPYPRVDPTPLRAGRDWRKAASSARIVSSAAPAADRAASAAPGVDPARLPRPPR